LISFMRRDVPITKFSTVCADKHSRIQGPALLWYYFSFTVIAVSRHGAPAAWYGPVVVIWHFYKAGRLDRYTASRGPDRRPRPLKAALFRASWRRSRSRCAYKRCFVLAGVDNKTPPSLQRPDTSACTQRTRKAVVVLLRAAQLLLLSLWLRLQG
jgi:hypothetical protein